MNEVIICRGAKITANSARLSIIAESCAHHFTRHIDDAVGFPDHCEHRGRRQMLYQVLEKWFGLMDGVEPASEFFRDLHKFCGDEFKGLFLEARDYFAGQVPLDTVGFDDD